MKTAVGLMMTIITALVATGASAEWRLYVNRDNKAWSLERAYKSNDECDRAARTLYRSGQALGVGCAEYPSPGAAQAQTAQQSAEFSRTTSSIERQAARAYETPRPSNSRTPRVAERPARAVAPRPVAAAERVSDPISSHPAAVIFPPSGGVDVRAEEPPRPAVVAHRAPEPRRQAAPAVAPRPVEDDKSSAAVSLAKAATEASATPAKETEAEAAKREAAVTADQARRTPLRVFGGVVLAILTGAVSSVYRIARANPLRALAVGLIELGLVSAAFAYPVVELWTRLRAADSIVLSWIPGVIGGIVVAGVGVVVLALELTRRPAHAGSINLGAGAPVAPKPQAPVELIKPGETVKTAEPSNPVEPVRPVEPARPLSLQPVNFLEPAAPESPRPEIPKWAKPPAAPPKPVEASKPVEPIKPVESAKPIEPEKPVEVAKPADTPAPVVGGS